MIRKTRKFASEGCLRKLVRPPGICCDALPHLGDFKSPVRCKKGLGELDREPIAGGTFARWASK